MTALRTAVPRYGLLAGLAFLCLAIPTRGAAQVEWERVSPEFHGATFVNNPQVCADCHDNVSHRFDGNEHLTRFFRAGSTALRGTCEACHGPRSKHVEDERPVAPWAGIAANRQSAICLQCHSGGDRMNFMAGAHQGADVSCTACHTGASRPTGGNAGNVTGRPGQVSFASNTGHGGSSTTETCLGCHGNVRGQLSRPSHHPVREGQMECASCHNVHGSNPSLLNTSNVNETCNSCHTEKRGPFVWEHAPVRESCLTCHDAHGSSNRRLLNRKESFLCMQCHSYGGHINLPRYNRTSNPYGEGCVNCHMTIHGSNHPSGVKFTR